ncbi:hypothetical protein ACUNGV_27920 [Serratia sp. IR-2025]
MDNKLSELSKPAWIVGQQEIDDFMRGDEALLVRGHDHESTEPALRMYSQEYVSALLQRIAGVQEVAVALREWIDAVPDEVAASLPTMPGVDRDWVDSVISGDQSNG